MSTNANRHKQTHTHTPEYAVPFRPTSSYRLNEYCLFRSFVKDDSTVHFTLCCGSGSGSGNICVLYTTTVYRVVWDPVLCIRIYTEVFFSFLYNSVPISVQLVRYFRMCILFFFFILLCGCRRRRGWIDGWMVLRVRVYYRTE